MATVGNERRRGADVRLLPPIVHPGRPALPMGGRGGEVNGTRAFTARVYLGTAVISMAA